MKGLWLSYYEYAKSLGSYEQDCIDYADGKVREYLQQ